MEMVVAGDHIWSLARPPAKLVIGPSPEDLGGSRLFPGYVFWFPVIGARISRFVSPELVGKYLRNMGIITNKSSNARCGGEFFPVVPE